MTKYQSLIIYGSLIVVTGISLILFQYKSPDFYQYVIASCMMASAAFALVTAHKSRKMHVRLIYHELHAVGMIIYSFAVLFLTASVAQFLTITSYFLIYYGMAEIIFCFWLFNLGTKINVQILIMRLVIGFVICIGAVAILSLTGSNQVQELKWYGILLIVIGIHVVLYKPIMKSFETPPALAV